MKKSMSLLLKEIYTLAAPLLGIKNSELYSPEGQEQIPNSFMAWHANFVTIDRKKPLF